MRVFIINLNFEFSGMLDHIIVETSGVKMPLNRMAVVSVIDSKTLSVTPYDPNVMFFQAYLNKYFLLDYLVK